MAYSDDEERKKIWKDLFFCWKSFQWEFFLPIDVIVEKGYMKMKMWRLLNETQVNWKLKKWYKNAQK